MLYSPIMATKLLNHGLKAIVLSSLMCVFMSVGLILLILVLYLNFAKLFLVFVVLFIIGSGMGLSAGVVDNLALSKITPDKSGVAAGVLNTFRLGSEAIGVSIYASLILSFTSLNEYDLDFRENLLYSLSFALSILAFICCFLSALIVKMLYNENKKGL